MVLTVLYIFYMPDHSHYYIHTTQSVQELSRLFQKGQLRPIINGYRHSHMTISWKGLYLPAPVLYSPHRYTAIHRLMGIYM